MPPQKALKKFKQKKAAHTSIECIRDLNVMDDILTVPTFFFNKKRMIFGVMHEIYFDRAGFTTDS
jgi:hypothetical protein